ncbi:SanA/YdcF family protein [Marinactinospora rubrisoli]|uniref:Vancomycin high temperature exclusion protein n=1 Tax=Marinactinospora rubrisoli TaxID=2715399 RepID=A0ABW2KLB3_9ACTN
MSGLRAVVDKMRKWWLPAAAGLGAVALFAPVTWLHVSTAQQRYPADDVPARAVAVVLGAGLRSDGRPTRFLAERLDVAAELYGQGRVEAVLVTGDNSRRSYNETDAMRDYLVAAGLPAARVVGDYAGFSTWESCTRARRIFGVREATVITQAFHLPRAVALCRAAGIDTVGVAAVSSDGYRLGAMGYGYVREVPAAFKAVLDATVRPDPTFLGDPEPGVREALSSPRG